MNKEIATQVEVTGEKEIAETLGYTQEFNLKPSKGHENLKRLFFKLMILAILTGAACALIFGIGIAKAVI